MKDKTKPQPSYRLGCRQLSDQPQLTFRWKKPASKLYVYTTLPMINYTSEGEWTDPKPREIVNPQRNYRQQALSKKPILKKESSQKPKTMGLNCLRQSTRAEEMRQSQILQG
jgi:hypothetical protein